MSGHTIVIDYSERLVESFRHTCIVAMVDDLSLITPAAGFIDRHNTLVALMVSLDLQLSELTLLPEWCDIPLAFYLPSMGEFRNLDRQLEVLKTLNVRIFFAADRNGNYTACRILSSLGIATGLFFTHAEPDWEAMCDLTAYTVYGKMRHAPIEPFHSLITGYEPDARNSWDKVWFDNPDKYLHISGDGKIALTRQDLLNNRFIGDGPDELSRIEEDSSYQEHREAWRLFFLKDDGCAYCPAWRVCLGRFEGVCSDPANGCAKFFLELMDAAEQSRKMQPPRRQLWQP